MPDRFYSRLFAKNPLRTGQKKNDFAVRE